MEKLRRAPYRCRSCQHRFYVYIPRERDEIDEIEEPQTTPPEGEAAQNRDVAKPAEP
jgi:hypothetical protein